ncbi:MAG: hemolysin family protein [Candidatus Nanopelagicales bacterium]
MTSGTFALLGIVVVLVLISWFFVAAETAFGLLSRVRLQELSDEGDKRAGRLLTLVADPPRYINVLLLLHTFITLAALAVLYLALGDFFPGDTSVDLLIATAVMTVVSYVVLGVSARTVGRQHPERVAAAAAGIARVLAVLLTPVSWALIHIGNAITPGKGYARGPFTSQAELRALLDRAGEDSLIEDDERQMIHSVFELGGTIAREVMVPRTEVVFIERDKSLRQAMSLALRSGFSRIPVVGEDADDVVGVVFLKDLVKRNFEHRDSEKVEQVGSIMRSAHFVPDSKPADELLREMQASRVHMAIVVDEFGGTAGLVTIEDILEEIVGEIDDEYDTGAPEVVRLGDGVLRVSSRLSVEHLCELTGMDLDPDRLGVETVAGLLARRLGHVPIPGAEITEQGWRLEAESAEGRRNRIGSVLVEPQSGSHV